MQSQRSLGVAADGPLSLLREKLAGANFRQENIYQLHSDEAGCVDIMHP